MKPIFIFIFCIGILFPVSNNAQQNMYSADSGIVILKTFKYPVQQVCDSIKWGAPHILPVSISLPRLGSFKIYPPVSYAKERPYDNFMEIIENFNDVIENDPREI